MQSFKDKVKRLFTRETSDDRSLATEEFIHSLNLIVGLDQLLESLSAKIREILDADTVYVVLFEPITNRYVGKKAKGNCTVGLEEFGFSSSDNLIRWLRVNQCPLDLIRQNEVVQFLSGREQELLARSKTVQVVPLIVLNRLTGVLFIGQKRTGEAYRADERIVLARLASQSALAIEHATLLQSQEDRLKRLYHADKLATVGELAAGAAHEIRNPLTSIRSTVQYVQRDLPAGKRRLIEGLIEEVDRIDQIINGLLSFSRSSELQLALIDLEEVLDQTLLLLDSELRKCDVIVQKHFALVNPQIPADAAQLKQVFLNILLNSIQAMPEGGAITLTTKAEQRDQSVDWACVTIHDTGPGILAQDLPRVFDPFFTTKETGTGLGLSIAYGIISKHGGDLDIASKTGRTPSGTTVIVRLPQAMEIVSQPQ